MKSKSDQAFSLAVVGQKNFEQTDCLREKNFQMGRHAGHLAMSDTASVSSITGPDKGVPETTTAFGGNPALLCKRMFSAQSRYSPYTYGVYIWCICMPYTYAQHMATPYGVGTSTVGTDASHAMREQAQVGASYLRERLDEIKAQMTATTIHCPIVPWGLHRQYMQRMAAATGEASERVVLV